MPAKKKAAKKKAAAAVEKKPPTKAQTYSYISEQTGLTRNDVASVFDSLNTLIKRNLNKRTGNGTFTVPGLMKIKVVRKPATKAKKNVPNPFRPGETMDVAAKPARNVVKVLPLKGLKEMA